MSKNKKVRRREIATPVADKNPIVSVIIPMYNSAKFIPQTLESLLYQTLENFEVVVVDDCSTDNSVEVVESFSERFKGKLRVVKMRENTGTPGLPRNVGIQIARGKYIAFLDSDDLYTKTALAEQVTLAEKFSADVIHMNDTFRLFGGKAMPIDDPRMTDFAALTDPANHSFTDWRRPSLPRPKPVDAPTPMSANLAERVKIWLEWKYRWVPYSTFCRREFLIENQIFFSDITTGEDVPFCFECMCLAKTCVQVPNVVYIIRPRAGSTSREDLSSEFAKHFRNRVSAFNAVFNEFERIMDKIKFFTERKDYRYAVLNWVAAQRIPFAFQNIYAQVPAFKLNDFIKAEFNPDDASLIAYLFNAVNVNRLQLASLQQELYALKQKGGSANAAR